LVESPWTSSLGGASFGQLNRRCHAGSVYRSVLIFWCSLFVRWNGFAYSLAPRFFAPDDQ
jgi:hypothetical protein